jgi:putative PIN family toxin of toxin-antitoxin system
MFDTNIILSAAVFPNGRINRFLEIISEEHTLFICSYSIEEFERVIKRKFPNRVHQTEEFLRKLRYMLIHTPTVDILNSPIHIRDNNDYPILASALIADVDILITGDKDFTGIDIERPEILSPAEFMDKYMSE